MGATVPDGIFWGYRELEIVGGGLSMLPPGVTDWIARVEQWDLDDIKAVMYDYSVYNNDSHGDPPDAYPATFTQFGFPTRLMRFQARDNWIDMQMEFQGIGGAQRTILRNFICFESMTGFRIRNHTPGNVGKYQLIVLR